MKHLVKTPLGILLFAAMLTIGCTFGSGVAEAGVPFPIPCTGDKIVKVMDLPAEVQAQGRHFDIGYIFKGCARGEFVGYLGLGRQYVVLPPEIQQKLLEMGVTPPSFIGAAWENKWEFGAEWAWVFFITWGIGAAIKNKLLYGTFAHPKAIAKQQALAAAKAVATAGAAAPTGVPAPASRPVVTSQPAARTGFGQRNLPAVGGRIARPVRV